MTGSAIDPAAPAHALHQPSSSDSASSSRTRARDDDAEEERTLCASRTPSSTSRRPSSISSAKGKMVDLEAGDVDADAICQRAAERLSQNGDWEKTLAEEDEKCQGVRDDAEDVIWVGWDGEDDPQNPMNWCRRKKWTATTIGIAFTAMASCNVSAYSITQGSAMRGVHATQHSIVLGITVWTLGFGSFPLVLAPFSEVYGRRQFYIALSFVFAFMYLPVSLAHNLATVLVPRFISGCCASGAIALVSGTLADVWATRDRGLPMALFTWAAFSFTGLGATIFGYVELRWGFRVVNMTLFIVGFFFSLLVTFVIKESRASVLLSRKAARLRKETGDLRYQCRSDAERASLAVLFKTSLLRPVRMLFTEPVVMLFSLYLAFAWGDLYLLLECIPYVFSRIYHFNEGEQGLVFLAQVLGATLSLGLNEWANRLYVRDFERRGPEGRIYNAMAGGILIVIGGWGFAWTSRSEVFWLVPCLFLILVFCGMAAVYLSVFNYLADAYTLYASSALSAQSFLRNVFGAVFPLFSIQMYDKLGVPGAGSLMAGIATMLAIIPFLIFAYGGSLRARSPFAKQLALMNERQQDRK